jgi:serine protease AprX
MKRTKGAAPAARIILVMAALAALLFGAPPVAQAQSPQGKAYGKMSQETLDALNISGPDDLLPVIVQTYGPATDAQLDRARGKGAAVKGRFAAVRGYAAAVPASQLEALAEDPDIERISYDSPVKAHMDVAYKAVQGATATLDFPGVDGRGVGVAIIDTGVGSHDDLVRPKDQPQPVLVQVGANMSPVLMSSQGVGDYFGHGTHVAGIINGNAADSSDRYTFRSFRGIAPGARLISVRALGPDGSGYTSDIIAGIDWVVANKALYNIRVLNLSLGHPVYESYKTDPLCRAVKTANDAGIVVVVAAGNDGGIGSGFGTITSPGNEPNVITVGALDDRGTVSRTDDVLAPYSSKGPTLVDFIAKPDLVAPGTYIQSLRMIGSYLDTNYPDYALRLKDYKDDPSNADKPGYYYTLSGTSMAAPMVAGAAALMIQKDPSLTPATVKGRLMLSAFKDDRLIFETGAGFLNIDGALKATGTWITAASPSTALGTDGYVYVQDLSLIWGSALIWGFNTNLESLIWGELKALAYDVSMTGSSTSVVTSSGTTWPGHKAGTASVVDNSQVSSSSLIWAGSCSILTSTTGVVDGLTAIWGGGKGGGGKH